MSYSRLDNERLDRLASEVKRGGGLALPSFFAAILHELLDNGPADDDRLIAVITSMGSYKSKKVAENWGHTDRNQWEFLTSDLVEQLASYGYIVRNDDNRWEIGDKFTPGVRMETIPARKGFNTDDGVVVWPKEERDALDREAKLRKEVDALIRQPRGRSHNQTIMNKLRNSVEKHGQISPILKAADDTIIDGRHRYEIDKNWPGHYVRRADGTIVSTQAEILAAILEHQEWLKSEALSPKAISDVERILGELAGSNTVKRDRVEAELRRDAARSNRAIAGIVGVDDVTVGTARRELENAEIQHSPIHHYGGAKGTSKPKHLSTCWCGEGDANRKQASGGGRKRKIDPEKVVADYDRGVLPKITRAAVAKHYGVPESTARDPSVAANAIIEAREITPEPDLREFMELDKHIDAADALIAGNAPGGRCTCACPVHCPQ